jgi:hypothetical protein
MVSGFGEGTEDAKAVAGYIDRFRIEMQPAYDFMDEIVQRRAWSPEFYETIQKDFPEDWGDVAYKDAFYAWRNAFTAEWPSLLTEPDSEKAQTDDVKLKAIIAAVEIFKSEMDPANKVNLFRWAQDNINENKIMFTVPLDLDFQTLAEFVPPVAESEPAEPHPFAAQDSVERRVRAVA